MEIKAIRMFDGCFMNQSFAFGGEEGQEAFDEQINKNKEEFKQEWLFPLFDELYNFEKGISSSSAFVLKVESLINS